MTLRETLRDIIDKGDAKRAGEFADKWRRGVFIPSVGQRVTATYKDILGMVERAGRDPREWETLLEEADNLESAS